VCTCHLTYYNSFINSIYKNEHVPRIESLLETKLYHFIDFIDGTILLTNLNTYTEPRLSIHKKLSFHDESLRSVKKTNNLACPPAHIEVITLPTAELLSRVNLAITLGSNVNFPKLCIFYTWTAC